MTTAVMTMLTSRLLREEHIITTELVVTCVCLAMVWCMSGLLIVFPATWHDNNNEKPNDGKGVKEHLLY